MGGPVQQPQQTSNSSSTSTATAAPSPEAQELLNLALPGVRGFAAKVPQRYGQVNVMPATGVEGTANFTPAQEKSTVAPFTAPQIAGQGMALNAAGTQGNLAAGGAGAERNLFGNIWDPSFNPNLQGAITAATRPITQNLNENILPSIRGEAVKTGNFGGSRQGIAEGIAARGAETAIGDTAAKIAQNEYETNINAQLKALGLLPTVQQAQVTPAATTSAVGDVQQGMEQARLGEKVGNFNYDQLAPFLSAKELLGLVQGLPGGTTTTAGMGTGVAAGNVPQPNPALSSLGSAAAGASLGSMLMPGVGTGIGAGAGALLPFLLNR